MRPHLPEPELNTGPNIVPQEIIESPSLVNIHPQTPAAVGQPSDGMAPQTEAGVGPVNVGYRGRVRTGCLTCRASKVRCDEQRPVCKRCDRLSRACVYKKKAAHLYASAASIGGEGATLAGTPSPLEGPNVASALVDESPRATNLPDLLSGQSSYARNRSELQSPVSRTGSPSLLSMMVSQDILLCTTIDLMMANEMSTRPSFAFFQHSVASPYITPYDPISWQCFKDHVVDLAGHNTLVAAVLLALESLYKAQSNGLSTAKSLSLYETASTLFRVALSRDDELDRNILLDVAFLLHLAEMLVPEDTGPGPLGSAGDLTIWLEAQYHTKDLAPLTIRIASWLLICHAAARRGGNKGMLSDHAQRVLRAICGSSALPPVPLNRLDPRSAIFQSLAEQLYNFHFQLQILSGRVADLSHYHRSRVTSEDQEEAFMLIADLKEQMQRLWDTRPSTMRASPAEIRSHLSLHVSEPVLLMVAICEAIYHHEIVEIGRNLSDPPFASPEAREHLGSIRAIIENPEYPTAAVEDPDRVNVALLRPLFLYAIEILDQVDTEWAVKQIRKIKDPISRSEFFASFAEGLATAQREKGRRVTTKWWCWQTFEVAPPYL